MHIVARLRLWCEHPAYAARHPERTERERYGVRKEGSDQGKRGNIKKPAKVQGMRVRGGGKQHETCDSAGKSECISSYKSAAPGMRNEYCLFDAKDVERAGNNLGLPGRRDQGISLGPRAPAKPGTVDQ